MLVKGHHEVVLELVKLIAAIKVSARLATVHGVGTPWRMQVKIILQEKEVLKLSAGLKIGFFISISTHETFGLSYFELRH